MPDALGPARAWLATRTSTGVDDLDAVLDLKGSTSVSVVLPARNEAATVGEIVDTVRSTLVATELVDEVVVVDSRSSDDTARIAADAGATVVSVPPDGPDGGKGEAMLLGVRSMTGDAGVFLDADVVGLGRGFVTGLLGVLLADPSLVLVKGFYDRPSGHDGTGIPVGGGRVTELVARHVIRERAPELAGFVQPLAGEVAFRRAPLLDLPWVSGYGVDVGLLLGVLRAHGLDAMAQVDLGERVHAPQGLEALGRMGLQVEAAFDVVLDGRDEVVTHRPAFDRTPDGAPVLRDDTVVTRRLA